jgi:glycosyltransferase involved in cell wall biosynthesis
MKKLLPVSIVIPVKNPPEDSVSRLAHSIFSQSAWPQEIILIDTNDTSVISLYDTFRQMFPDLIVIKLIHSAKAYPGKARNVGVAAASQQVIAFLDLMTTADPTWLEKYFELLNKENSDGITGKCVFIGKNFFSWILIDSLFGRGPVNSFPGSLFNIEGIRKIGPMLDKARAGEDNEWLQRAQQMNVNLIRPATNVYCNYLGFQNITFKDFLSKWIRNYFSAAQLPQYKLIAHFNLLVWSLLVIGLAMNWNAFFAEWNVNHPMYIPHISKISLLVIFIGYIGFRTFYLPLKRGSPLKKLLSYRIIFIFIVVLISDAIKSIAFLLGSLSLRRYKS